MSRTWATGRGAVDRPLSPSTRRTASAGDGWRRAASTDSDSMGCAPRAVSAVITRDMSWSVPLGGRGPAG
jgi:hypothetical protein